jgi:hypothetical protein
MSLDDQYAINRTADQMVPQGAFLSSWVDE